MQENNITQKNLGETQTKSKHKNSNKLLHSTHNCIQSIQSSVVQDHTKLAYLKAPNLQLEKLEKSMAKKLTTQHMSFSFPFYDFIF